MDAKQIFQSYLIAQAQAKGRPFTIVKNWNKVMERDDWSVFDRLAKSAEGTMSLVDIEGFFESNFKMRKGRFTPHQFFQKASIENYNRWKKLPKAKSTITQVIESLRYVIGFCKNSEISVTVYFGDRGVYPHFLKHLASGRLHRFIFVYYVRKFNTFALKEIPPDVIEHAINKNVDDIRNDLDIWWMQLLAEPKCNSLIKKFFERFIK